MHHLNQLQMYFITLIFNGEFTPEQFQTVADQKLREILETLNELKKRPYEVEQKLANGEKIDSRLCSKAVKYFSSICQYRRAQSMLVMMTQNGIVLDWDTSCLERERRFWKRERELKRRRKNFNDK